LQLRGDLIVDGTIAASKLIVNSLSSVSANLGTITAGILQSANGKVIFNLNESYLDFYD